MESGGAVYIITNRNHTTFYTGVTSDLYPRIVEHREKKYPRSFTARYRLKKLVHFESYLTIMEAIDREKYIKGKSRQWKIDLIEQNNPNWEDLFYEIMGW